MKPILAVVGVSVRSSVYQVIMLRQNDVSSDYKIFTDGRERLCSRGLQSLSRNLKEFTLCKGIRRERERKLVVSLHMSELTEQDKTKLL